MRSKLALATTLGVALIAPAALPCGAPFGNGINVDPKQDIVVVHKNGTETYVFQPRFCGSAQQFGLILPVPAKLSAQPALSKADVFTKLVELSQPQTVYSTACANRGGMGGSAGGYGDSGSGTSVVSSGTVGFMDYAQLETSSVDALTTWLTTNGYPYDSLATSAFDYYVQKGWYFLTFKVDQGAFTGSTTCKDLGPVKFSFPTASPVVPTRMATARSKDTSGTLSYATNFSWRIFGITAGTEQIGFSDGTSYTRLLNYSGLLVADDISRLDGLAVAGDRADKLTITFNYGSTDPDIALTQVAGQDYREIINSVTYIQCTDGGVDSAVTPPPADAGLDVARPVDVAVFMDVGPVVVADTAGPLQVDVASPPVNQDAAQDAVVITPIPPESPGKGDAAVVVVQDAASVTPTGPDASPANRDAGTATPVEPPAKKHSGCSFSASSGRGNLVSAFVVALLVGILRRRR